MTKVWLLDGQPLFSNNLKGEDFSLFFKNVNHL